MPTPQATAHAEPIPYSDDVEQIQPDVAEHIVRCTDSVRRLNTMTFDLHRHGVRGTHVEEPRHPARDAR